MVLAAHNTTDTTDARRRLCQQALGCARAVEVVVGAVVRIADVLFGLTITCNRLCCRRDHLVVGGIAVAVLSLSSLPLLACASPLFSSGFSSFVSAAGAGACRFAARFAANCSFAS